MFGGAALAALVAVSSTTAQAQINKPSYKSLYHACMKVSFVTNSPIAIAINFSTCVLAFPFKGTSDQQCMQLAHTMSYEKDKMSRRLPTDEEKMLAEMFESLRQDVAFEFGCDTNQPPMVTTYIKPSPKVAVSPKVAAIPQIVGP